MDWLQSHLPELAMSAAMAGRRASPLPRNCSLLACSANLATFRCRTLKILRNPIVLAAPPVYVVHRILRGQDPWLDSLWDARSSRGCRAGAGMLGDSGEGVAMAAAIIGARADSGHFHF